MVLLGAYLLAMLATLVWLVLDRDATGAFEAFSKNNRLSAREIGFYWQFMLYSLSRAFLLALLTGVGVVSACLMFIQNPWELGPFAGIALPIFMLATSLAIPALPHLAARIRFQRFLSYVSDELTELVSAISSEEEIRRQLEPATGGLFDGEDGWTAWHPTGDYWEKNSFWNDLIPVVYLHREAEPSLIIPVDFSSFLAWSLPPGSFASGDLLPLRPRCSVTAMHDLPGREGWMVIEAELTDDELVPDI